MSTKVEHEKTLDAMSRDERSLLLYLETRAVDHGGLVAPAHMNAVDFETAKRWNEEGFLGFSRLKSEFMGENGRRGLASTHVVELGELAWRCAAEERRRRAERAQSKAVKVSLVHFAAL